MTGPPGQAERITAIPRTATTRPASDAVPARRRMSREERRRQLIAVAIDLFSQKGFSGTTTREIGRAAGVTEAVIFQHFATKGELYRAVLLHKADVWGSHASRERLRALAEQRDDEAFFGCAIADTLRVMREDKAFVRVTLFAAIQGDREVAGAFYEVHKGPGQMLMREYIEQRQREGAFRGHDPQTVMLALDGMTIHYGMVRYLFGAEEVCSGEEEAVVIGRFVRIFLDGLRSAEPFPAARPPSSTSPRKAAKPPRKSPRKSQS